MVHQIREKTANQRYLHLCANHNIKEVRMINPLFESAIPYKKGENSFTVATFLEFEYFLRQDAFKNEKIISVSDERFILSKVIRYLFRDNEVRLNLFVELRFQLYDLFSFLMFHDTKLTKETISKIGKLYSDFEEDVFNIYRIFSETMGALVDNTINDNVSAILGDDIFMGIDGLNISNNLIKEAVNKHIKETNVLVFDGFLLFDDLLIYVLKQAIKQKIQVYLTAKDNSAGDFLFDTTYPTLFAALNQKYTSPPIISSSKKSKTALQYLKQNFGNIPDKTETHLLEPKFPSEISVDEFSEQGEVQQDKNAPKFKVCDF